MFRLYLILSFLSIVGSSIAQKKDVLRTEVLEAVEDLNPQIISVCQELWDYSETALLEEESARYLSGILENEGFEVKRNVSGMPTAFVATYGSGKPVIGILAEYDALPGVGNQPVPYRQPREDGITSGQGCGHNLFGSAGVPNSFRVPPTPSCSRTRFKATAAFTQAEPNKLWPQP